jgi:putative transposase
MPKRKADPADLTDAEWKIREPLIPAVAAEATKVSSERREIVTGIRDVLRRGCPWRWVAHELPAWGSVYGYFRVWPQQGLWEESLQSLGGHLRQQQGRDAQPSAAVIESQSIKTSAVRGPEKGYDAGKKIWGRKRPLPVETQGHLLAVQVPAASRSDLAGAQSLLEPLASLVPRLKRGWGDSPAGGSLIAWSEQQLGGTMQVVRGLSAAASRGASGWQVLPSRWVLERTFAWLTRWRRLARDQEGLPQSSEAFLPLSASRRMLSLLAPACP